MPLLFVINIILQNIYNMRVFNTALYRNTTAQTMTISCNEKTKSNNKKINFNHNIDFGDGYYF